MENKITKKRKGISFKKRLLRIWKKIKRFGKLFVEEVKNLWNKFIGLPKKVKNIVYIWGAVLLIVLIIIIAGHSNNVFLGDYKDLEEKMNEAAVTYVQGYQLYMSKDNRLNLNLEVLQKEELITNEDISDKSCEGFSLVYYDDLNAEYVVDSYINCDKYTTDGYSDYK